MVPIDPFVVDAGFKVSEVGARRGRSDTVAWAEAPLYVPVSVAVVAADTGLVCTQADPEQNPAGTGTVVGGTTAGLSLASVTAAPPAGAAPFRSIHTVVQSPPASTPGDMRRAFSDAGCTVTTCEVVAELSVADSVTAVASVTCCDVTMNCAHAVLAGMLSVAGTGSTDGFELAMLIVAPEEPAAFVSCTCAHAESPGNIGFFVTVIETGRGGPAGTVNDRAADHAVGADVVGEALPWNERTRQNLVPEVSDKTTRDGPFSCGESSSMLVKLESRAICSSYPLGCGF